MLLKRTIIIAVLATIIGAMPLGLTSFSETGPAVDHGIYGDLLQKHVQAGKVNYAGFKSDETQLDHYLTQLGEVESDELSTNEQFAFYANAYNAWSTGVMANWRAGKSDVE